MEIPDRARAVHAFVRFLVSGAIALAAFGATLDLQGGWQATTMAIAVLAGVVSVTSFFSLRARGERNASTAPRPPRARPTAERAPRPERRRERGRGPVAAHRGRLSSATS